MNCRLEFPITVALLIVLVSVPGRADAPERFRQLATGLRDALDRGALVELQELGTQAGAKELTWALESGERKLALAAIAAGQVSEDAWVLLEPLAELASSPDRPVAAAAAAAAADIAARLDRGLLLERDIPAAAVRALSRAWHALATTRHRWADVRVHALEASVRLHALLPDAGGAGHDSMGASGDPTPSPAASTPPSVELLSDSDPELRRAAFELLPRRVPSQALDMAARAVGDDPDPVVALVAAQTLCRGLGSGEPAEPVLATLGEAGLERLRHLVATHGAPLAALLDSARCLIADSQPRSLRAVRTLRDAIPAIRKPVRRLLSRIHE